MLRGTDVVVPAGQVRPQRLGLALHRHDSRVSRLESAKPLGELRQAAPVARRARLDGLIANVDVRSHATRPLVAHTTLGKALVQFGPARCRPDEFTSLFDGDACCALLARSAFHVGCTVWHSGDAIQLTNAGNGAIVHHRVARPSLRTPTLAMFNDGHRALCRLFPPTLRRLHDLIGFRADFVDRDVQVDVVGVLMQRRNDLMFLELELFQKHIQQFLNLLGCGLLILMPRCNPVLDRVLGLLALHREGGHLGLLPLEGTCVEPARRQVKHLLRLLTIPAVNHAVLVDVIPDPVQAGRVIRRGDVLGQVSDVGRLGLATGLIQIERDQLEDHWSAPLLASWSMNE